MLLTRVMPCLLVQNRRLVKTVRFKNPAYVGDPVNAVKIYDEKEVDEIVVVDISATRENRPPDFDMLKSITDECFMPMTYGGGVRSIDVMKKLFHLGMEKVAINSYAVENPSFVQEATQVFGSQSVVVSIDAKRNMFGKYQVFTHGGTKKTGSDAVKTAQEAEKQGAGEILLNSIDRDGTWDGYDIELVRSVASAVSIPVIAVGGAGCVEHIGAVVGQGGASAAAIGSMAVYQGKDLGVLIGFPTREEIETALKGKVI